MRYIISILIIFYAQFCYADANLSSFEKNYLKMIGTVKVCVDPDWYPFEKVTDSGEYVGIGADLLHLAAARVGMKIELYRTNSWDESIRASQENKCQILSFLNETPFRNGWLNFTRPHFTDVNVFVTRNEHPFIPDPSHLTGETIVFPSGTAMEELVRKRYPNLKVIDTASEEDTFRMVSDNKADMTMRSLIMAAYTIKKEGLFNLKISGQLPDFTNEFRIGVVKSRPMLVEILDKGVATITNGERDQIVNRYISIKAETGVDYVMIAKITSVFLLFALFGFYWAYRMKLLNDKLRKMSETDILTGLYNRMKLNVQFTREVERASRYKRSLSVIMMDIDHFKKINDEHGHLTGDKVLVKFARLAQGSLRKTDIIGRWGGEEFLIVCPETGADEAAMVAERIRKALSECDENICDCTVSGGVAVYRENDTEDSLLSRADAALYQAKNSGRNKVCLL